MEEQILVAVKELRGEIETPRLSFAARRSISMAKAYLNEEILPPLILDSLVELTLRIFDQEEALAEGDRLQSIKEGDVAMTFHSKEQALWEELPEGFVTQWNPFRKMKW